MNYGYYTFWIENWITPLYTRYINLQNYYGSNIQVTSAYRNPAKQVCHPEIHGSPNSHHVYGAAFDFNQGSSESNYNVAEAAYKMGNAASILLYDQNNQRYEFTALPEWPDMLIGVTDYTHGHIAWNN